MAADSPEAASVAAVSEVAVPEVDGNVSESEEPYIL